MDPKLLEILACPVCKQSLHLGKSGQMLICQAEGIGYPIVDGIPHLVESSAVSIQKIETAAMTDPVAPTA
jgi:uncharacterized protein YbaR (Trm112 family)